VANAAIDSLQTFVTEGGRDDDVTLCVVGR
jgi:hypothetical protein